jgi:hypothetical protein
MKSNTQMQSDPRKQLRALRNAADNILNQLADTRPIIIGTLSLVKRRCGSPRCRCARGEGEGHATWTLLTKYQGKRRCQVVRKKDLEKVRRRVERYQTLKAAIRQLKATDSEIYRTLRRLLEQRNEIYK